jgi:hypothetical protein
VQKITILGTNPRKTYAANVNSITWCCWNIAVDESEIDYWKSEVITFVVKFFLPIFFTVDVNMKVKVI